MNRKKLIELNEKVIEKAMPKVEKAILNDNWDCECFEALSMAIKNVTRLEKEEGYEVKEYKEEPKAYTRKRREDESEFMACVYGLMEEYPEEGADKIMVLFDEHMDDLRVIHPKMHENLMVRLKGMK